MTDGRLSGAAHRLLGRWINSHEEDEGPRRVFRRPDHDFPRARARSSLVFQEDGEVVLEYAGPTDRRATADGRWSLTGTALELRLQGWDGVYDVHELEDDLLVLQRKP